MCSIGLVLYLKRYFGLFLLVFFGDELGGFLNFRFFLSLILEDFVVF